VTRRPALGLCATALVMAVACPRQAAAQLYQPLARRSLLTTEVQDERAVWVNPAGLARRAQATLGADLTAERAGGVLRVAQYGISLLSRNLAAGWKHDRYLGGSGANTFVAGIGLGDDQFSAGAAHRWNQGGQGAWDVALRGRATSALDVSVVWRNIGSPIVRDSIYRARFVPAAGVRLLGDRLTAGVEGDVATNLASLYEIRAGLTITVAARVVVSCHGTFSGTAARRGLSVLVGLGGAAYRGELVGILAAGGGLGAVGASGALVGAMPGPSRR
jgi:hypothetical protein